MKFSGFLRNKRDGEFLPDTIQPIRGIPIMFAWACKDFREGTVMYRINFFAKSADVRQIVFGGLSVVHRAFCVA